MIDLRDRVAEFEAAARRLLAAPRTVVVRAKPARCHPGRPMYARRLCKSCYQVAWRNGTLQPLVFGRTRLPQVDFIADYELLRSEGYTRNHIAERLGMARPAVDTAYLRAVRAGLLTPDRRLL